jgi:two-component system, cell cycle sensor histidine kinase and response regulator CckA
VIPADQARARESLQQLLTTGKTPPREFTLKRDDGTTFDAEVNGALIQSADGAARGAILITRDITERKRAADSLRKLSRAVEHSSALIIITDARGQIEYVNPKFSSVTGYPPDETLGRNPRFLKSGDKSAEDYRHLWATISAGKEWHGEFHNRKKNGDSYWESATISPIFDAEGNITHYVAIGEDITERRRLEEHLRQAQKMEAIGQLAGGVAHDFNNILAAMMMQTDLAGLEKGVPAATLEMLDELKASVERATSLTRQLLAFSRRQVMQTRLLNINEVVTSLTRMLQRILGEDVHLQLNLSPRPLMVRADAGMLDQVLLNLVVNARDAMPRGGRLVIETAEGEITEAEARTTLDTKPGRHVRLTVTDTGSGIAPEVLPHIFEPFFTTKEAGKGTGLGLATVFGIVKQHGGAITVDSKPRRGAIFRILLPAVGAAEAAGVGESARPKPRGGTETILLAEDDQSVRLLTRAMLERHGYQVLEAAHGPDALRVWDAHRDQIDLLLTDIVMPEGISGRELAARLQERKPGLRVIFTSGYSAEIAGRELTLKPGQNFIQKPSSPTELLETVRRCLDS